VIKVLTATEAAERFRLPYKWIAKACIDGRVPATKGFIDGYPQKPVWLIRFSDMEGLAKEYRPLKTATRPWIDSDDAALMELQSSCTLMQLAAYLDRTYAAVQSRLKYLRNSGTMPPRLGGSRLPDLIPRTAILLAKTCPHCGKLRDAKYFTRHKRGYFNTMCVVCLREKKRGQKPSRTYQERRKSRRQAMQEVTRVKASKWHQEYTNREMEVVLDDDKTAFQIAIELHRTYSGIQSMRSRVGFVSKKNDVRLPDSQWRIHFPEAIKALQQHFIRLGIADDGWAATE
jgi:hypothetical protein